MKYQSFIRLLFQKSSSVYERSYLYAVPDFVPLSGLTWLIMCFARWLWKFLATFIPSSKQWCLQLTRKRSDMTSFCVHPAVPLSVAYDDKFKAANYKDNTHTQSSGAVWKSRWTSWAPVPNKPTVSVDVKQHFIIIRISYTHTLTTAVGNIESIVKRPTTLANRWQCEAGSHAVFRSLSPVRSVAPLR